MRFVYAALLAVACDHMNSGPPDPDDCAAPGAVTAGAVLELGDVEGDFVPWVDGDAVPLTWGPQGGSMVGLRLRFAGDGVPACVEQHTIATVAPTSDGHGQFPVRTYEDGPGARLTKTVWVPFDEDPEPGEEVVVTTTAGTLSVTRTLVLE
jgi:hypothetical protein